MQILTPCFSRKIPKPIMHRMGIAAVLSCLLLITSTSLLAQVTTGYISGYVYDPGGNVIAGARLTATDSLHSEERFAASDENGFYRFTELRPGLWIVSASVPEFELVTNRDVRVAVNARVRLDFDLPVSGVQQSIEVTAPLMPIQTESGDLGLTLDREKIESLPLNRRDFLQLALLTPGVTTNVEDSELSTRGGFAMHANGGREEFNNFLLDGIDNNDAYVNGYTLQPSADTIQEFKIATNNYSAEYGRSGAGQVNVVTRSGGNSFHGFAYEYLRNRTLDARNFFDNDGEKHKYIRNQFGFGGSGPIVRDTTYFFLSGDFLRERKGLRRLATVPTELERQGNLSELEDPIYDPFTGTPFEDNIIPEERISPIALELMNLFPDPTQAGLSNNFLGHPVYKDRQDQVNVRVDHRISSRDELAGRYSYGYKDLYEPYSEDTASVPGFGDFVNDRAHSATVQYKRIVDAGTIFSLRFGFNRLERNLMSENAGTDAGQLLGVDWLDLDPRSYGYPSITVAGLSGFGDATNLPILRAANTYQFADDISMIHGNHMFKAGMEVRWLQLDSNLDLLVRGSLSFSGAISGSGISDFLLGYPSFGLQSQADNPINLRSTAVNVYFQDEWKLHPRVTLNLGLRYEYNTPPIDPTDGMSTLNMDTGEIVQVGTGGVSRSGLSPDTNNFGPRVGFAWSVDDRTVLRGGYGIYYDSTMLQVHTAQYFNPPRFNMRVFFPSAEGLLTLEDPFPLTGGLTPPPSLSVLSPDIVAPYVQHWNVNIQRSIGSGGAFSIAYAGSKGTRLIRSRDINQPAPAEGYIQMRRPLPSYGSILFVESSANSNYQSLQASFNYPMFRGLSLWTAYTFSKSIDNASSFLGNRADPNFPQNSRDPGAERAASSFDTPHRLVLAYVYELPNDSRWTRNTEFQGIVALQSGHPCTPVLRFDNSNTGNTGQASGLDRPNAAGNLKASNPTSERWFNTDAFEIPDPYTFGSAGRNIIRGPGFASVDVSLSRRFAVSEYADVKLEVQAFNLFNRTNFDLPELNADDPGTFGRILSAKDPRQIQFALRLSF